jgi:hypothetical protein
MSIADVLSRVDAIGQLADQAAAPTAPASTSSSFGAALAAATTGTGTAATASASAMPTSTSEALLAMQMQMASALSDDQSSDGTSSGLDPLQTLTSPSAGGGTAALDQLTQALATGSLSSTALATPSTPSAGAGVLAAAESQVGVTEQPPGSNDGPQLDVYRSAVAGSQPGQPWCADFASWAAAQAGSPLGETGQGLGSVAEITSWAQSTGRLLPPSATPAPGDLILYGDRHTGVVESVNPDGSLTTVEGNYANAVTRVQRSPSEATGYVRL